MYEHIRRKQNYYLHFFSAKRVIQLQNKTKCLYFSSIKVCTRFIYSISCIFVFFKQKMFYLKDLIKFLVLVAVVSAQYQPDQYNSPPVYKPSSYQAQQPYKPYQPHQPKVKLHKLCSWNVLDYKNAPDLYRDDSWGEF